MGMCFWARDILSCRVIRFLFVRVKLVGVKEIIIWLRRCFICLRVYI